MIKAGQTAVGLVLSAWALTFPALASAQSARTATVPTGVGAGNPYLNPFLNPYMNPYLNPAATQQPMNVNNSLLYLYAANAANGGIGSGRLSNPKPAAPRTRAANMPNSASSPGGGAARFFNPGPVNVNGAGRYYNQGGRHFMNNGR